MTITTVNELDRAVDSDGEKFVSVNAIGAGDVEVQNADPISLPRRSPWYARFWLWPTYLFVGVFRVTCLCVLLAIAATIPIVQFASLGYMLESAGRIARGERWRRCLPGLRLAGIIGKLGVLVSIAVLPTFYCARMAFQAELIEPSGLIGSRWRIGAFLLGAATIVYVLWALMRGGRIRDFIWPAPRRFFREFFSGALWQQLEDRLWDGIRSLRIPSMIWLGFRGFIGGLIWLFIPATLMVLGMQANNQPGLAAFGFIGFALMWLVLLYLPFAQVQFAQRNKLRAMFDRKSLRATFKKAPWSFLLATLVTLGLAIPLYLLRIENIPNELMWLLCLVFVVFTLPAKLLTGVVMRWGQMDRRNHWWPGRYMAWIIQLAIVPFYIGFLYIGTIASWEGGLVVYLQHAFSIPVPFLGN